MTLNSQHAESMWNLLTRLFPIHRALCGPGFRDSLKLVQRELPLAITEFRSGSKAFDWIIPKEFKVNEAYVLDPDNHRIMDFADNHYHIWSHTQPFHGVLERDELLPNIAVHPKLADAVPLRVSYYRPKWGLSTTQEHLKTLPAGKYTVHIDTEHFDGFLRMGEFYLPGESEAEILLTAYLCHPRGANDNLSGVVVGTELMKILSTQPHRRFSYRFVIWPETIGSIVYVANYPERIKKTVGGYVLLCLGDSGMFHYKQSKKVDSVIDRAAIHALKTLGYPFSVLPYYHMGSDERTFNAIGVNLPFGNIMRAPPAKFDEYHTSKDDLNFVKPGALFETLQAYYQAIEGIERARIFEGTYTVDPFLNDYGIYPYDLGSGEGRIGAKAAEAYYHLMGFADGKTDLLAIAERSGIPVTEYDRAVSDMLNAKLIRERHL